MSEKANTTGEDTVKGLFGDASKSLVSRQQAERVEVLDAATVVPVRNDKSGQLQVLMLKRNEALDFAPGSWVFPGGRLEESDVGDSLLQRLKAAASREAKEESSLIINPKSLFSISKWTTPKGVHKRFATWFFMADCSDSQQSVMVDGSEIVKARWLSPGEALALHQAGTMSFLPPAFVTLTELSCCASVAEAKAFFQARELPEILPKFSVLDDVVVMLYPGDAAYEKGDPAIFNEQQVHRVVMSPEAWQYLNHWRS